MDKESNVESFYDDLEFSLGINERSENLISKSFKKKKNGSEPSSVVFDRFREILGDTPINQTNAADLAKSILAASADTIKKLTDDDLNLRFIDAFGAHFRFSEERGWFHWTGKFWKSCGKSKVIDYARQVCRKITEDLLEEAKNTSNEKTKKFLENQAYKISSVHRWNGIEQSIRGDLRIAVSLSDFDQDPDLLNTPEGIFDLRTGISYNHKNSYMITKMTQGTPTGKPCPKWDQFLRETFEENQETIDFLQRFCGYSIHGVPSEEKILFCYGQGANGKSVFLGTLLKVLGNYATACDSSVFLDAKYSAHPTEIARLTGRRLVVCSEFPEGRYFNIKKLKGLTGRDPVLARFMGKDFFEFLPEAVFIFAGNHKPQLGAIDLAIKRRFLLVPFKVVVPEERRDPFLRDKLLTEADGIATWCGHGYRQFLKKGLNPPASILAATESYFQEEDVFSQFLGECCVLDPLMKATSTELYKVFKDWKEARNERPFSQKRFANELIDRGFEKDPRKDANYYLGIGLNDLRKYSLKNAKQL